MLDGVPDRPLGEREPRTELADRREGVDQGLEFRLENGMGHGKAPFGSAVIANNNNRHCERSEAIHGSAAARLTTRLASCVTKTFATRRALLRVERMSVER